MQGYGAARRIARLSGRPMKPTQRREHATPAVAPSPAPATGNGRQTAAPDGTASSCGAARTPDAREGRRNGCRPPQGSSPVQETPAQASVRFDSPDSLQSALNMYMDYHRASDHSPRTVRHYLFHIGAFIAWCSEHGVTGCGEINAGAIRAYQVHLQEEGWTQWSRNGSGRAIKAWCNFLAQEKLIRSAPQVAMPRAPELAIEPLRESDIHALLAACTNARDRAVIWFLLETGVRAAECCALNLGDLDFVRCTARVLKGKGAKSRTVVFGQNTRDSLITYLAQGTNLGLQSPVWRNSQTGRRLTPFGLGQLLGRVARRAGVAPANPHRFRHTFGCWSVRNGMDLIRLQRLMGHAKLDTLNIYLQFSTRDLVEAHREHGPARHLSQPSPVIRTPD